MITDTLKALRGSLPAHANLLLVVDGPRTEDWYAIIEPGFGREFLDRALMDTWAAVALDGPWTEDPLRLTGRVDGLRIEIEYTHLVGPAAGVRSAS